jgi:hypothetical protein
MLHPLHVVIVKLVDKAFHELETHAHQCLLCKQRKFLKLPDARCRIRPLTDSLSVSLGLDVNHPISFYCLNTQISKPMFMESLNKQLSTPRLASRALSRIDSFTRWCVTRKEGFERAEKNLLETQKPWIEKLNSRLGMLELSGDTVSTEPDKADGEILYSMPLRSWPDALKILFSNKNRAGFCAYTNKMYRAPNTAAGVISGLSAGDLLYDELIRLQNVIPAVDIFSLSRPLRDAFLYYNLAYKHELTVAMMNIVVKFQ